jgi:cyclic pyranopterin phosphate synthase
LYLCLFAGQGYDLRTLLREQALNDEQLRAQIDAIWRQRSDRYSQLRSQAPAGTVPARRVEMSYIGG